jgi:hypothetical protein
MEAKTVKKSILEARRFRELADLAYDTEFDKDKEYAYGGKNTAAMKRASMDLSRALADLRQGR